MTQRLPQLGFISVLIITSLIYLPGLQGPFLFDDYANLSKIGDYNGVRNLDTFKRFIFGGIASPTGRPIALLSFITDGTHWPTSPFPFKLTNVLLHILTGTVLFKIIQMLVGIRSDLVSPARANWLAIGAAASWMLHPFFISTTLYVVQRMAILSALFVGLGLLIYLHGRCQLKNNPASAYAWMSFSVIGCTLLATLSKENGALLPILILAVECSVLDDKQSRLASLNTVWKTVFLWLPLALLAAYMTSKFMTGFSGRPFTLNERLLTESRIIFDYLYHLFIPQMYSRGLYTENFPISTDLFNPATTFASIIGIFTLLWIAHHFRKKVPFLTLAITFFFAGHILESTILPLELYFEHRNYLPSFFLFLPLVQAISCSRLKKPMSVSIASGWFILLIVFAGQRASLWGNPNELAIMWANNNPYSKRAQVTLANSFMEIGQPQVAVRILERANANIPDDFGLFLHLVIFKCLQEKLTAEEIELTKHTLTKIPYDLKAFYIIENLVDNSLAGLCLGISKDQVAEFLTTLSNNPKTRSNKKALVQLDHLLGKVYAHQNKGAQALNKFNNLLRYYPDIEYGLLQSSILATHKFYTEALMHLDITDYLLQKQHDSGKFFPVVNSLHYRPDYKAEIDGLRKQIQKDIAEQSGN